jgi:succinyl-CoA synthetase beta subunit
VNLDEQAGKAILAAAGIPVPRGRVVETAQDAAEAAEGRPSVIKAQVPVGRRGKAGGVLFATTGREAGVAASQILGLVIDGHRVERVLVEELLPIRHEYYVAITFDAAGKGPVVLLSAQGGMEVEEASSGALRRLSVNILDGFTPAQAAALVEGVEHGAAVAAILLKLYAVWRDTKAELLEINPLAVLADGSVVAADCKLVLDDAVQGGQAALSATATPLERQAAALGFNFHQLGGSVAVLANGAGLTMATLDMVRHAGGTPANFLEIGGDAYTKAKPALELVLALPGLRSLVVNFCGAYARTDVMAGGVIEAWQALAPAIPIFFSIHGTGEDEAVALVRDRLGIEPFDLAEDAVRAAVEAAR